MEQPLLQLPFPKQCQEQQKTGGIRAHVCTSGWSKVGQSHSFTGTKWTPFGVNIKRWSLVTVPLILFPLLLKPKLPTVFSDAEFGLLKNIFKPLQYTQQYGQKKKKKKSLFYSPLLTKAFPCELDQAFLCNMEWHWSIGYFPPLLHQIPLSRKH